MKLLLTGASGLVGAALAKAAGEQGHEVIGIVGRFGGELPGLAHRLALDLARPETTVQAAVDAAPDAIVNCAAISEPAACEADLLHSEAMNVELPRTLARVARRLRVRIVHVSSEQAFDGERTTPYAPDDVTTPINVYGRQKVASEAAVLEEAGSHGAVVRAPLLMGDSPTARRSVHERLFADWAAGRVPRLYTDEFRQPCTAGNLGALLLELAGRPDLHGCFHWAGTELVDRYKLGWRIRAHFGLTQEHAPIAATTHAQTPGARRQPCLALNLAPLAALVETRPQSIAEQLASLRVPAPCQAWYAAFSRSAG